MTDSEIIVARWCGAKVKDIVADSGMDERDVYSVLRRAGLCRDQRPEREYVVTVMVPEIVRVVAKSDYQARERARALYNDNVRIETCEEVEDD